jgi:CheY-like chemotaxis protein
VKARILIVDDEPEFRNLIAITLQRFGYEVLEAGSGHAALDVATREMPDLAILDVMMPDMTGLEVAQSLKRNPVTASIPIIVLSARGKDSQNDGDLLDVVDRYLLKPISLKELAIHVQEAMSAPEHPAFVGRDQT